MKPMGVLEAEGKTNSLPKTATCVEARALGSAFCKTDGSKHYRESTIEPADLLISKDLFEDFAISNIVKYAIRFKKTRNKDDLKKAVDYANILCGIEIFNEIQEEDF